MNKEIQIITIIIDRTNKDINSTVILTIKATTITITIAITVDITLTKIK